MQLEWLNSTLSPVVYEDIALSIKINIQIHTQLAYGNPRKQFIYVHQFFLIW